MVLFSSPLAKRCNSFLSLIKKAVIAPVKKYTKEQYFYLERIVYLCKLSLLHALVIGMSY